MRVCLAAGGTGGHLFPGLAVARALRQRGHRVHFVVTKDDVSGARVAAEGFPSSAYRFGGFPRALSLAALGYPALAAAALLSARRVLRRERPDAVIGMGGYVSVPLGLGAAVARVPLVLHEQNVRAGLANRFLARWASAVAVTFPETEGLPAPLCVPTGLPLRADLSPRDAGAARRALGLAPEAFTVLIFGGSQGARGLNRRWLDALPALRGARAPGQFIHLCGDRDVPEVRAAYDRDGRTAFVRGYFADMPTAYAAADFVVARAGANTVCELTRLGLPSLLIPYPYATDDHQSANAARFASDGRARVLAESEAAPAKIVEVFDGLPALEGLRSATAARSRAVPPDYMDAADRVARVVESAVERRTR